MVAILRSFLAHFQLHFQIIFIVWQENDYKMKPKMKPKMTTVKPPKCKHLENDNKMHFPRCLPGTFHTTYLARHVQTLPQNCDVAA